MLDQTMKDIARFERDDGNHKKEIEKRFTALKNSLTFH